MFEGLTEAQPDLIYVCPCSCSGEWCLLPEHLGNFEKELGGCLHKGVSRCRDALESSLGSFNGVNHNWAASDISSVLKHMNELISFGNAFESLQNAPALSRFSQTVQPTSEEKY